ncbi:hypothetical protein GCM10029963_15820 [Micromonospora andamanensis]
MRLSRIIMALTVGLAVVAVPTAAGAAQPQPAPSVDGTPQPPPYPPVLASLTVNRPTIFLGETVILTGRNYGPNETVDIVVSVAPLAAPAAGTARRSDGSTVAMAPVAFQASAPLSFTARTNSEGVFTRRYTPSVKGLLTFTGTGRESGRTASTQLRVLHKEAAPAGHRQQPGHPDEGRRRARRRRCRPAARHAGLAASQPLRHGWRELIHHSGQCPESQGTGARRSLRRAPVPVCPAYTRPCASIASATRRNPLMLAPAT